MKKIQYINSGYNQTNSGSIDYDYYDQRARHIRSESIFTILKTFFTDKKNSRQDVSEICDVMTFNRSDEDQIQFNSLKKAA